MDFHWKVTGYDQSYPKRPPEQFELPSVLLTAVAPRNLVPNNLVTNLALGGSPAYYSRAIFGSKRRRLQTGVAAVKFYGNHIGDGGLEPGIMAISGPARCTAT